MPLFAGRSCAIFDHRPFVAEQRRVSQEGWGARLLALAGCRRPLGRRHLHPKWTSTTYTLLLLRDMGLAPGNPQALRACRLLLDEGFWTDGGINYYPRQAKRSETCITSMVLSIAAWFGLEDERLAALAATPACRPDARWRLELPAIPGVWGRYPFLLSHHDFGCSKRFTRSARHRPRGANFCWRTGCSAATVPAQIVKAEFTRFHFPTRWHYDVLRGLDYFRAAGCARDPRLQDAIDLLESRRQADGTWRLAKGYPGKGLFRSGTGRTAEPLEYSPRPAGAEWWWKR